MRRNGHKERQIYHDGNQKVSRRYFKWLCSDRMGIIRLQGGGGDPFHCSRTAWCGEFVYSIYILLHLVWNTSTAETSNANIHCDILSRTIIFKLEETTTHPCSSLTISIWELPQKPAIEAFQDLLTCVRNGFILVRKKVLHTPNPLYTARQSDSWQMWKPENRVFVANHS